MRKLRDLVCSVLDFVALRLLELNVWLYRNEPQPTLVEPQPTIRFQDVDEGIILWRVLNNVEPTAWLSEQLTQLESEVSNTQPRKLGALLIGHTVVADFNGFCDFSNSLLSLASLPQQQTPTEQPETLAN